MPRKADPDKVRIDVRIDREAYEALRAAADAMDMTFPQLTNQILVSAVDELPMMVEARKLLVSGDFTAIAKLVSGRLDEAVGMRDQFLATVRDGDESSLSDEGRQIVEQHRRRLKKEEETARFSLPASVPEPGGVES